MKTVGKYIILLFSIISMKHQVEREILVLLSFKNASRLQGRCCMLGYKEASQLQSKCCVCVSNLSSMSFLLQSDNTIKYDFVCFHYDFLCVWCDGSSSARYLEEDKTTHQFVCLRCHGLSCAKCRVTDRAIENDFGCFRCDGSSCARY